MSDKTDRPTPESLYAHADNLSSRGTYWVCDVLKEAGDEIKRLHGEVETAYTRGQRDMHQRVIEMLQRMRSEVEAVNVQTAESMSTRAAFLVVHESVTAPGLAKLTGSHSIDSSACFSVNDGINEWYPLFQFQVDGQPLPRLAEILSLLKQKLSYWQIALWFVTPNAWMGGWRRPVDVLTESPDVVINAARHQVSEHVL